MKKQSNRFLLVLFIIGLILAACTPRAAAPEEPTAVPSDTPAPAQPTDSPTDDPTSEPSNQPDSTDSDRVSFDQLGISLEIPEELVVIKDPIVNLDDPDRLESYLFYIQNYEPEGGPGDDYFQMYGHLQFGIPATAWEDYKNEVLSSDMYEYAREIEVNGLPGIDSQFTGQRNRFVYHFMLDGRVLTIAVSDPTEENKTLADQIINTLEFNPGTVTDASLVQLINEPQGYYQMYLPADWEYNFNPPAGIRLSDLQATSPDAEVVIEETDGPHSNVYYKKGVTLSIAILEDDSALSDPAMAQISSKSPFMIAGIAGNEYIFTEPSTMEGEIQEVRYYHNGLSYLVRFSYAEDADRQQIDWLIRNILIAP
jgi:hypothetical protein